MKTMKLNNHKNKPPIRPFHNINPIKNKKKDTQMKNDTNNKNKKCNSKIRSISIAEKKQPKEIQFKFHNSFDNSLELDYLNFSQIDLFKLNGSFDEDIFTPNKKRRKNRIVEDRYQDSISTMNGNSTVIKNDNDISEKRKSSNKDNDNIANTPSTMCNYYEQSSNKKTSSKKKFVFNNSNIINEEIKKNLSDYYNKNIEQNENLNPNEIKDSKIEEKYQFCIKFPNAELKEEKPSTQYLKQNLKSNSILQNNRFSNPSNKDKLIKKKNSNKKNNKENRATKNKNELSNVNQYLNKKYSKSNEKLGYKLNNKSSIKNTKDNIKINNNNKDNYQEGKPKSLKNKAKHPINLIYNQNANDGYFVTPRNFNKKRYEKNFSSNKNSKINAGSLGKYKSFNSSRIKKNNVIKNNLIYMNNNEINNPDNSNYKMINELINDFEINNKNLNKTTPKNKTRLHKEINSSKKDFIRVNLKNSTKSSSNFASTQKQFYPKNNSKNFYPFNQNNNHPNSKLKSEIKHSLNIYKNISKNNNNYAILSPENKNPPNIFDAQKTLTEQNEIRKIQETPKNYKIQKFESVPFTAMVKKIFVGSSKKDHFIKFDSSKKQEENIKTKTEKIKCIFKPKTQSDLKSYDKMFGANGKEYANEKHVKQKLLDRMNKATNNWQYLFMGNKNKKIIDEGISNLKFNKNENIISDGSEKDED